MEPTKHAIPEVEYRPPRWGLFGLAMVALSLGISYNPVVQEKQDAVIPVGLRLLTVNGHISMWLFSIMWMIAGVMVLVAAIRRRPGWAAVGGVVGMCALFGSFYLIGWIVDWVNTDHASRIYILGFCLIGFALYVGGNVPPDPPTIDDEHHVRPPYYLEKEDQ